MRINVIQRRSSLACPRHCCFISRAGDHCPTRHSCGGQFRIHGERFGVKEKQREKGDRIVSWMGRIDSQRVPRRGWLQPLPSPSVFRFCSFIACSEAAGIHSNSFPDRQTDSLWQQEQEYQQRLKKKKDVLIVLLCVHDLFLFFLVTEIRAQITVASDSIDE